MISSANDELSVGDKMETSQEQLENSTVFKIVDENYVNRVKALDCRKVQFGLWFVKLSVKNGEERSPYILGSLVSLCSEIIKVEFDFANPHQSTPGKCGVPMCMQTYLEFHVLTE